MKSASYVSANSRNRVPYIDAIKGFTIFFVVYMHVLTGIYGYVDFIAEISISFLMPIFFFISGYFIYPIKSGTEAKRKFRARIVKQLLPAAICFLLYALELYGTDIPWGYALGEMKLGYWFPLVMVEYFMLAIPLLWLAKRYGLSDRAFLASMAILSVLAYALGLLSWKSDCAITGWLSLNHFGTLAVYFLCGIAAKKHNTTFLSIIGNRRLLIVASICWLCVVPFATWWLNPLRSLLSILLIFMVFKPLNQYLEKRKAHGHLICDIGGDTLEIYYFHWFFLTLIIKSGWAPQISFAPARTCFYFILTAVIVAACIAVKRILKFITCLIANPCK